MFFSKFNRNLTFQYTIGVDSLFTKINCDRSTIDEMLGSTAGVSDETIMQYLGLVEQRTNELLAVSVYVDVKVSGNYRYI